MNKYKKLYSKKSGNRDYRKFEDNIVRRHVSEVLYKNPMNAGFLSRLNDMFVLLVNSVKRYKTIHRPFLDAEDKNFN